MNRKPATRTAKPSTAVATYHGPRPGASRALAKSTAAQIQNGMAKHAPSKLSADGRTFHVEDYRAASQLIRQYRANATTPEQNQWVDAMATAMAAVFEADSKQYGVPFGVSYFVAGTR